MAKVLVTGAAGFIASHLSERLMNLGHQVVLIDNFDDFYARADKEANLAELAARGCPECVELDIRDRRAMAALWKAHRFEVVCHLAARAGVRPSLTDPDLYWDVNTVGTLGLLELAREYRTSRFIFASSSSVYGDTSEVPFRETDAADRPISPYAASKRAAELLCHTYHHLYGMDMTCLRFFTVYGPRNRPDLAIAKFTSLIDSGLPVTVYGDGTSRRDYTYVDDIVDGIVAAIDRCRGYHVYNLGHSDPVELLHLIQVIESSLGKKAVITHGDWQVGDVRITYADISRARGDLGFNPTTPIEVGIERYVRWYRDSRACRVRVPVSGLSVV